MDMLAVNALPPVDTIAPQAADRDATTEDGKTFVDALSSLTNRKAGQEDAGGTAKTSSLADVKREQAADTVDPASSIAFVMSSLAPAAANKPDDDTSGQALIGSILVSQNGSQSLISPKGSEREQVAAKSTGGTEGIIGKPGMIQANAADPRLIVANKPGLADHAEAEKSALLPEHADQTPATSREKPARDPRPSSEIQPDRKGLSSDTPIPADFRQASQPSAMKPQSSLKETTLVDRVPAKETVAQPAATQNASMQAVASQLNVTLHAVASPAGGVDTTAAALIGPRVGMAGWSEAMGQKVVMMASEHIQHAELRLNPEGLGPLQVVLSLDKGAADVQFLAHDAQVREALQSALPKLQEMLTSAGFSLDRVSIDSGSAKNQGNQGNAEQFHQQKNQSGQGSQDQASLPMSRVMVHALPGRIDTFA